MKKENKIFSCGSDLLASLIVGVLIGFYADKTFDTKPIFIIIFFILGSVAGILSVIKTLKNFEK